MSGELFCMGTGLVTKGNNFHDFLFASLNRKLIQKQSIYREKNATNFRL